MLTCVGSFDDQMSMEQAKPICLANRLMVTTYISHSRAGGHLGCLNPQPNLIFGAPKLAVALRFLQAQEQIGRTLLMGYATGKKTTRSTRTMGAALAPMLRP